MFNKLLFGLLCLTIGVTLMEGNADVEEVIDGNTRFANNFYQAITKNDKGNILFSPLSAHTALSMLYQGAAGETATKFANALNVPNQKVAANGYESIIGDLNSLEDVTLHIANKIYVAKQFTLKSNFKDVVTKSFSSEVEPIDFAEPEQAANNINQWVESKTNSKIRKLVDPQNLEAARLVLLNAVYFKGIWKHPFPKKATTTERFHVSGTEKIDCEMMHLSRPLNYRYDSELDAQLLQIPYVNQDISLVIILPNNQNGIEQLENKLVNVDLATVTKDMTDGYLIDLSLPKFKIETTMDLKPILKEMGLEVIFEPNADFSDVSESSGDLLVSKAIQKTFIEVNEEGTEAAGSTGFSVFLSTPPTFKADHPFIILLQAKSNTLFYGKVMRPTYD